MAYTASNRFTEYKAMPKEVKLKKEINRDLNKLIRSSLERKDSNPYDDNTTINKEDKNMALFSSTEDKTQEGNRNISTSNIRAASVLTQRRSHTNFEFKVNPMD